MIGESVRYDARHKRNHFVVNVLAQYFELVPVCPEVAIGLGIPREPIHLVGSTRRPKAVGTRSTALDVTRPLADYGRRMAQKLGDISGYLFKSKSPSCGMRRVKIHGLSGSPRYGRGIYATEIMRVNPLLPVEEEWRLNEPARCESFIERLYAYRRWQDLLGSHVTPAALIEFHTRHSLLLMAHGPCRAAHLGHLVTQAENQPIEPLIAEYGARFMRALRYRALRRWHAEALFHALNHLKSHLDNDDLAELVGLIHAYRQGLVQRLAPVTLLSRHVRHYPELAMDTQLYLNWQQAWLTPSESVAVQTAATARMQRCGI